MFRTDQRRKNRTDPPTVQRQGDHNTRHAAKPDFIGIGSQKAATDWVHDVIKSHPSAWMPPLKELNFWTNKFRVTVARNRLNKYLKRLDEGERVSASDLEFLRRAVFPPRPDLREDSDGAVDFYRNLFSVTGSQLTGEFSPVYSGMSNREVERLKHYFPDTKILYMVRNPIDRFWSQLNHEWRHGRLSESVLSDPGGATACLQQGLYRGRSFQVETYRRWSASFSRENIRYFFFDDVRRDPESTAIEILGFLGLEPTADTQRASLIDRKSDQKRRQMSPDVRRAIASVLSDELDESRELFGGPAREWR
jgi:hypothetical protein